MSDIVRMEPQMNTDGHGLNSEISAKKAECIPKNSCFC